MDRRDAGGIVSAVTLLSEHGGAIEADLQRYYGLHLGDFPWPLTARRLLVLVTHPPADSALCQSLTPAEARGWTDELLLLATVVDELRNSQHLTAMAAGAKGLKAPKPIPRPGVKQSPTVDPSKAVAMLEARGITIPEELKGGDR